MRSHDYNTWLTSLVIIITLLKELINRVVPLNFDTFHTLCFDYKSFLQNIIVFFPKNQCEMKLTPLHLMIIYVRFWFSSKSNFLCYLSIESLQGHYFQDKRRNKLNWSMWSVIYTAITMKKPDITFFKGQFRIAQQCNSNGISLVYSDKCAQSIIMTGLDWLI